MGKNKVTQPNTIRGEIAVILVQFFNQHIDINQAVDQLEALINEEGEKVATFAVELSDKIEMEKGTNTNYEEWRAFKGFRNTIRDEFLKQKDEG